MSTWFITGCSTGLGRHFAQTVLERGHNAVVTARNPEKIDDFVAIYPNTALALALDVTNKQQVQRRFRPLRPALALSTSCLTMPDTVIALP